MFELSSNEGLRGLAVLVSGARCLLLEKEMRRVQSLPV
jgi:hypothetical protein